MTTSEFTKLLKNPSGLSNITYETLDELLLQYPYCNGIRMLLLKKYKNEKHSAFDKHLALASMYASDRGKLYDFLNATIVPSAKIVKIDSNSKEEKKTKVTTELISPPPVFYCKVSVNPPMLAFQKPLTAKDLAIGNNLSDETEKEVQEKTEEIEEAEIALSTMPIEEWLQDFEPPRIVEKSLANKKGFKLSHVPIFEKGMFDFLEKIDSAQEDDGYKDVDSEEETKLAVGKGKTKKSKKASKVKGKGKSKQKKENLKIALKELEELASLEKEEEGLEEFDVQSLDRIYKEDTEELDKFDLFLSKTNGFLKSISHREKEEGDDDAKKWEEDSVVENEDIVSETLADLLALQGQKIKAIKMYETLSLKFPEKNRLFAEKIAELK
jgi:hypothetical protein